MISKEPLEKNSLHLQVRQAFHIFWSLPSSQIQMSSQMVLFTGDMILETLDVSPHPSAGSLGQHLSLSYIASYVWFLITMGTTEVHESSQLLGMDSLPERLSQQERLPKPYNVSFRALCDQITVRLLSQLFLLLSFPLVSLPVGKHECNSRNSLEFSELRADLCNPIKGEEFLISPFSHSD